MDNSKIQELENRIAIILGIPPGTINIQEKDGKLILSISENAVENSQEGGGVEPAPPPPVQASQPSPPPPPPEPEVKPLFNSPLDPESLKLLGGLAFITGLDLAPEIIKLIRKAK